MSTFAQESVRTLDRIISSAQREHRVPGLVGAVARGGELLWSCGAGSADPATKGSEPGPDTQYAIGSITKTFTAVMVMAMRDEGRLDLDDRIDRHLPVKAHGDLTLRRMLSHVSGLQREPAGNVWEGLELPDLDQLLDGMAGVEMVLQPRSYAHYSNTAFSLLGQVVAALDDRSWEESLQARILDPLGMVRTSVGPSDRAAVGHFVDPFSDHAFREPVAVLNAMAPAGALWSTAGDLAIWAKFIAEGADGVLSADTIEQMCQPQVMADLREWRGGFGLCFMLVRTDAGIVVGHNGGMPGFVSSLLVDRDSGTAAIALANSIGTFGPDEVAVQLLTRAMELEPVAPEPWRPAPAPEGEPAELVGRWWSEGSPIVLTWHDEHLEARAEAAPRALPPSVFADVEAGVYRTVSGRERGELLTVSRDDAGHVDRLHWATYAMTRQPLSFGDL